MVGQRSGPDSVVFPWSPAWRRRAGFTLIEVLVVVAILALLVSILLPSLSRARVQARISMCKANARQIATVMSVYQAEHVGAVPIIFNYGAEEWGMHDPPTKFAGNAYISVALRNYEPGLKQLKNIKASDGTLFNPDELWYSTKRREYETRLMPAHYACPFGSGKGRAEVTDIGDSVISGPSGTKIYTLTQFNGRMHAYGVWQWEGQNVRGLAVPNGVYPLDPGPTVKGVAEGRTKHSVLSWCARRLAAAAYPTNPYSGQSLRPADFIDYTSAAGSMTNPNSEVRRRYRKWTPRDAQAVMASSLSDAAVFYCMQGQWLNKDHVFNPESHKTDMGGGTNAAFADTHVEWVKGTQIGWP